MEYTDKIYGKIKIDEPVINDLIASEPLQRLKAVNQYGASFYRFPHLTTNRFEHSVGVYYILKRLGASVEEQIAGLLHDVPHTAFSHVSDIVFEDPTQTFHEKFHEKIIFDSNIPKIVKNHGISIWNVLHKSSFGLAERNLPDLCADRIDYFFRDCVIDKQLELPLARTLLDDMIVFEGDIVFQHQERAREFAIRYRDANEKLWAHPLQAALYYLLAEAIKLALEEGIITFDDLFTTDSIVYDKMYQSGNTEIMKLLDDMEHVTIREDNQDFDYWITPKARVVDPYVLLSNQEFKKKERLSSLDKKFEIENNKLKDRLSRGYFVKIV